MATLGDMRARGEGIILYCRGNVGVRWCNHSHVPRMDQLIQYFGLDYDLIENRAALLSRFVCEQCGSRQATLQITRDSAKANHGLSYAEPDPGSYVSIEEATRRHHAFEAERKRMGIKSIQEMNAEANVRIKELKDRESGKDPIGPPNPWANRKRGRWL